MKIYDLSQNKVVQFPDYIARIKLRSKHISKGGFYCTVQDIEKYVSVPPVVKSSEEIQPGIAPKKEVTWETVAVGAEIAQPEMQFPEEVPEVRKRRKRKTE
jgi:hypothetical protein